MRFSSTQDSHHCSAISYSTILVIWDIYAHLLIKKKLIPKQYLRRHRQIGTRCVL